MYIYTDVYIRMYICQYLYIHRLSNIYVYIIEVYDNRSQLLKSIMFYHFQCIILHKTSKNTPLQASHLYIKKDIIIDISYIYISFYIIFIGNVYIYIYILFRPLIVYSLQTRKIFKKHENTYINNMF